MCMYVCMRMHICMCTVGRGGEGSEGEGVGGNEGEDGRVRVGEREGGGGVLRRMLAGTPRRWRR